MQKTTTSKALVLGGAGGLLGQALVAALRREGYATTAAARGDVDLGDAGALASFIDDLAPDYVFNAVAYTQVDKAEDEEDAALRLNGTLPRMLGDIAAERPRLFFVQYSSDFVFDGRKGAPYVPTDSVAPLSAYGRSKAAGERALLERNAPNICVIRTAWLFGPGKGNFVRKILDAGRAKQNEAAAGGQESCLRVVHDQRGSPTYTCDLARYSVRLAALRPGGLFHIVNGGTASWYELAAEALRLAGIACAVRPVTTEEYPVKATRPRYSALDTAAFAERAGIAPRSWESALADYVHEECNIPWCRRSMS